MAEVARDVVVRGHVQGVFFRQTVRRTAERHGVRGWVANRGDGSVAALLEGEPDAVESVLEACRRGPDGASVDSVDVCEREPTGVAGFDVR